VDVVYGHRILINEDEMEIVRVTLPRMIPVLSWADYIAGRPLFGEDVCGTDRVLIWNEDFQFAMDELCCGQGRRCKRLFDSPTLSAFRVHEGRSIRRDQFNRFHEMQRLRPRPSLPPVETSALGGAVV